MIQIDMPMPDNCDECRFNSEYGYCKAMPDNFCGNTDDRKRPEWCPLKEQETVKPYIDIDEAKCPICKVKLTRQELLGDDVLLEDFFDYCPHCGREVKWE